MTTPNPKLLAEINNYYPDNWEEFYDKSTKVKAIIDEMAKLRDQLIQVDQISKHDPSFVGSVLGIKKALEEKKHQLIDAISEEKASISRQEAQEAAAETEKKRLALAEEANVISKNAQFLSKFSMGITIVFGICTILLQIWLNISKEDRIKQAIKNEQIIPLEKKMGTDTEVIQTKLDTAENTISTLTEQVSKLNSEITELKQKKPVGKKNINTKKNK